MHIRPFVPADTANLYEVCLRTGDSGEDATALYTVPTLLGEVYVGPYLALEPATAWVVDHDGVASAYALCAPDTAAFERRCATEWWPDLQRRYPLGRFPSGSQDAEVVEIIHDPPATDTALLRDFPAHLHIDLLPGVQGHGFGGELMRNLLEALVQRGTRGVHLGVATVNTRAIGFYEHLAFTTIRTDGDETVMGKHLAIG